MRTPPDRLTGATLVLPEHIAAEVSAAAALKVETAAVLLVGISDGGERGLRLLGRELHWVPVEAYTERELDRLTITSSGFVPPLARGEVIGAAALWVHTHPSNSSPRPSEHDRVVDTQLADLFRLRTGSPYYGSLVFSAVNGLSFTGHISGALGLATVARLWQLGDRMSLVAAHGVERLPLPSLFDRNIRALGIDVQLVLGELRVGVAGCGGTGSAVAEQLVRLGVRDVMLADPDRLSISNTTRVYGSTRNDVGRLKVDVLADHLERIAPEAVITRLPTMITVEATARRLASCDLVFGCTDDNGGRLVLSRLATYELVPVIDCGVVLSAGPTGTLAGIDGRVTTLMPGSACLLCRGRIDLRRAAAEGLHATERRRLADEGYAPALPGVEPSVVPFTSAVASMAVAELLERLIGYGPEPEPGELLLRFHERENSTNSMAPLPGHYCDPSAGKTGIGHRDPFLDMTWTA